MCRKDINNVFYVAMTSTTSPKVGSRSFSLYLNFDQLIDFNYSDLENQKLVLYKIIVRCFQI